jgi:hypothetical protein
VNDVFANIEAFKKINYKKILSSNIGNSYIKKPKESEIIPMNYLRETLKKFFDPQEENPIENSEELRLKYFEELKSLGGGCSGCQINGLKSKYQNKLKTRKLI